MRSGPPPVAHAAPVTTFVQRYSTAFGRSKGLLLRFSGLLSGEHSADGAWITDTEGRRWLDFGSFGLHLLGHRHPDVVEAASGQLHRMGLSGKVLGNAAATRCAEALLAATDPHLDRIVFASGGGEAVDMALKMAVLATGRHEFVAFRGSYHGKTLGALSVSDAVARHEGLRLAAPVRFVDPHDVAAVGEALRPGRIAAVIIEPVQGEGGIRPVDPGFLGELRHLCTRSGTLLILDEIQTGLGRCGKVWRSAADHAVPDVLLAGKTLGGGLVPLAAVAYASALVGEAATDPVVLASSFAGGALAGRVGETVLGLVTDERFLGRVRDLGHRTRAGLRERLAGEARIVDVRGEGLMVGVQAAAPGVAGHVVVEAAKRGLLVSFCLSRPSVLRVYPPAVCGTDELDDGLDRFAEAVSAAPTA